jgi:predicted RNA-binding protein with PUA-like domain
MAKEAKGANHWLMKTEPDTFSFDDLVRSPRRTTSWEGVRNYQARNLMRDRMRVGDQVFIYHSSCEEPGIVGTAEVVRLAHPDLAALDPKSPYFDERSAAAGESRWWMVDVRATARFKRPVLLSAIRAEPKLAGMMVIKRGARLSVQPVAPAEWAVIVRAGQPEEL